jgi:hypothetical protein
MFSLGTMIDGGNIVCGAWRRGVAGYLVAGLMAGFLIGPVIQPKIATAACSGVAGTEPQARKLAAACDETVVVNGSRTEFSQVVAQPNGRMRFESAVLPQRAYRDGAWLDIEDARNFRRDDDLGHGREMLSRVASPAPMLERTGFLLITAEPPSAPFLLLRTVQLWIDV